MRALSNSKQIAKNRINLERAARIKHNPRYEKRSIIACLVAAFGIYRGEAML